jgi:hypothetical protein
LLTSSNWSISDMRRITLLALVATATIGVTAQEDDTRQIVPEEFVKSRPAAAATAPKKPAAYRVAKRVDGTAAAGADDVAIGLTLWRLRPARPEDTGARLLVQAGAGTTDWIPERVDADAELAIGDHVRIAIECPREGYVYVLDREQYSDGTSSPAYLIFPTGRTRGGDNAVRAGRVIEIPARDDAPNYFTVRRSRPDQVAEVLHVAFSASPIDALPVRSKAEAVPDAQLAKWIKDWSGPTEQLARVDHGPWSPAEDRAGADGTRLLTQDDPPPQTIYRLRVRRGQPAMFEVRLPYGAGPQK